MSAAAAVPVLVAIGSNLGDRDAHVASALAGLRTLAAGDAFAVSSLYETAPVGPPGQRPYLNAAVRFESRLAPRALLEALLALERAAGRTRSGARDEARTLDLDLLFYGDRCIDEPGLAVPHPRLHERPFVLAPLREIAPAWRHPRLGRSVAELAEALERGGAWPADAAVRRPAPAQAAPAPGR